MISAKEIEEMLIDCLFKNEEILGPALGEKDQVIVEGIVSMFVFHPERLKAKVSRLKEIMTDLHPNFFEGWTFLNLPFDKDSNQWGEQRDAENLFVLCAGNELAKFQVDRSMWDVLPGGVPYVLFKRVD